MSKRYRSVGWAREGARGVARIATAIAVAIGAGACSVGPGRDDPAEITGSIPKRSAAGSPLSTDLDVEDWRRAKGALAIALDPQGNGGVVKWENPETETSGTFTPVAQPYVKENEICRAFVATIVFPGRTSSLQGTGCRVAAGEWEIGDVRPWRKQG